MKQVPWFWRKLSGTPEPAESALHLIRLTALSTLVAMPVGFLVKASTLSLPPIFLSHRIATPRLITEANLPAKEATPRAFGASPPVQPKPAPSQLIRSNRSITPTSPTCSASVQPSARIDHLITETSTAVAASFKSAITAQFASQPFPEIHGMARLAKVPVIMYHDVLPKKQVFFDLTPADLEADFQLIRTKGMTPISLDQLVLHLSTGIPLPAKPILLTFDDGYQGHYDYVYPLLKQYRYPAAFGIYTQKVNQKFGRSSLTWAQLREMAADPLVTIASHSVTHPADLNQLSDQQLRQELTESKRRLETQLGLTIQYFVVRIQLQKT